MVQKRNAILDWRGHARDVGIAQQHVTHVKVHFEKADFRRSAKSPRLAPQLVEQCGINASERVGRCGPRHQRAPFRRQKEFAPQQIHRERVGRTPAGFRELESRAVAHEAAAQPREHAEHRILRQRQCPRHIGEGGVSAEQFVAAET
jgi:hypothetical protein